MLLGGIFTDTFEDNYNMIMERVINCFGYHIEFDKDNAFLYDKDSCIGKMTKSRNGFSERLSINTLEGLFTYQVVESSDLDDYSITLDGTSKKKVSISNIRIKGKSIPKVNITLRDFASDISNLDFNISSHSIGIYTEKVIDGEPVSLRSISYENPNIEFESNLFDQGQLFDLRKFISFEQGTNGKRNYLYLINKSKGHFLTTSKFPQLHEGNKKLDYVDPDNMDEIVVCLLQNERVSSLYKYSTARIDEELPGLLSIIKEKVPFFRRIENTITSQNDSEYTPVITGLFDSIKSSDIDLPNENNGIPVLKKG